MQTDPLRRCRRQSDCLSPRSLIRSHLPRHASCVRDNYRLCIVVERRAHWPIMYVVSVPARNAHLRHVFIAAFATRQWTSALLDGRCIHKFIMPSSRTETESEFVDFFTKPSESVRLRDFENRNNTIKIISLLIYTLKLVHKINGVYYCVYLQVVGCCNHQSLEWTKSVVSFSWAKLIL